MSVYTLFVVDERGILFLSALNKVTDLVTKLEVFRMRTIELIGECSEEAIAVAEGWSSIQTERLEARVEEVGVGHGV